MSVTIINQTLNNTGMLYNINMKIINFLLQISLISVIVSPTCLDLAQFDGSCTDCRSVEVLVEGFCYAKMTGCLIHQLGPICVRCQNGYVLTQDMCVREAEFFGNTDPNVIPPVVIVNDQKLTREEIIDQVAEKYGDKVSKAHAFLLDNFNSDVKDLQIKSAQKTDSKKSSLVRIIYEGNGKTYQAILLCQPGNKTSLISFLEFDAGNQFSLTGVQQKIQNQLGDKIKDAEIFNIIYQNEIIVMVYIAGDKVYRIKIALDQKITFEELELIQLAYEEVLKKHSYLSKYSISNSIDKSNDQGSFFVFQLESIFSVSAEFNGNQFIVNNPIRITTIQPSETTKPSLVGGFSPFFDFTDPRFVSAKEFVEETYPELKGATITKVEFQIVAGTNYLIYYTTEDNSQYIVKVYFSIAGNLQILEATKDGEHLSTMNHNYNLDDEFLSSYAIFKKQSKVLPIPQILTVQRRIVGSVVNYKVIYPDNTYGQFQYNRDTQETKIISYTVDGENILNLREKVSVGKVQEVQGVQEMNQKALVQFLKNQRPQVFQKFFIQSIVKENNQYTVNIVSSRGTYQAKVKNQGSPQLIEFETVSDLTCFDLNLMESSNSQTVFMLDSKLKGEYDLEGYKVEFVQVNIVGNVVEYRITYVSSTEQQIIFELQEFLGQYTVKKAFLMNYGYGILNPEDNDPNYEKAVAKGKIQLSNAVPFFAETNGSHVRLYLKDEESTYQLICNPQTETHELNLIQRRGYLIIPNGFDITEMLSESEISQNLFSNVEQTIRQHYQTHIKDATVAFASKTTSIEGVQTYKILYFLNGSYYRVEADLYRGQINIKTLYITSYKAQDFTDCRNLNQEGTKCLSCQETEIQYQGKCFTKIEGCHVQAADICIKCESKYTLSNGQCLHQCSNFFV